MNIALFGASGWVGGTILREALERGHSVTAIVRDPSKITFTHERLSVAAGDSADAASVASGARGHEVAAAAIGGRATAQHEVVPASAQALLAGLGQAGVPRLVWVGGAGSLEVAPGMRLVDTPQFPADYKAEALAQADALEVFRATETPVTWTVVSPAIMVLPGTRSGRYRSGGDQLLTNDKGESSISVEDYAAAFVDEIEKAANPGRRISVIGV
ncbi:MAG: NAD(P)-dependent oxidoreductase [Ignavibacteriae bacterium]|nr:NAD(P)-dependent oxidoreductase [Ignavibacteriota bacterium]